VSARVVVLVLAEAFSLTVTAAQQSWEHAVAAELIHERVIGLLDIPEIIGAGCGPREPRPATLYATPSRSRAPVGAITLLVTGRQPDGSACNSAQLVVRRRDGSHEELPSEETDYEIRAALVHERSGLWFRLSHPRRAGCPRTARWARPPSGFPHAAVDATRTSITVA
jgi:hypothetical protein